MLEQALFGKPHPKFVLIQDKYVHKQRKTLEAIMKMQRSRNPQIPFHIFTFENYHTPEEGSYCYNMSPDNSKLEPNIDKGGEIIVIIDSLADYIYNCGEVFCIHEIQKLLLDKNIYQIITVLHTDLFIEPSQISKHFEYLSTLNIVAIDANSVECTHKRPFGRVVKKNLIFDGSKFIIKEFDLSALKITDPVPSINPENLSTFKIGLEQNEIQSRNNLILPYLKVAEEHGRNLVTSTGNSGKILYQPDENDDFDEEDPDDDLDI